MPNKLRMCTFRNKQYLFHQWFQEGGDLNNGGSIDVGAILEDFEGHIEKVWHINEIVFRQEDSNA